MTKFLFAMFACLVGFSAVAQTAATALEGKTHTPQQRYDLMKQYSQTFQDYKVIKENILDAVWKISTDSLAKRDQQLAAANARISSLQQDVALARSDLKAKEDSMQDILFASTHIHVLGKILPRSRS